MPLLLGSPRPQLNYRTSSAPKPQGAGAAADRSGAFVTASTRGSLAPSLSRTSKHLHNQRVHLNTFQTLLLVLDSQHWQDKRARRAGSIYCCLSPTAAVWPGVEGRGCVHPLARWRNTECEHKGLGLEGVYFYFLYQNIYT